MQNKRPGWVWVISIFYFISAVWTLLSIYLIYYGEIPLEAEQKQYFDSLTTLDLATSIGLGGLNFLGAVSLFMLKKVSYYFFGITLFASIVFTLWHALTTGWLAALGGSGITGAVLGFVLAITVFLYVKRLKERGILS